MKVKEASQILNINYQTAKSILRRFNKSGAIFRSYNNAMQAAAAMGNSS
jgi:transposase